MPTELFKPKLRKHFHCTAARNVFRCFLRSFTGRIQRAAKGRRQILQRHHQLATFLQYPMNFPKLIFHSGFIQPAGSEQDGMESLIPPRDIPCGGIHQIGAAHQTTGGANQFHIVGYAANLTFHIAQQIFRHQAVAQTHVQHPVVTVDHCPFQQAAFHRAEPWVARRKMRPFVGSASCL